MAKRSVFVLACIIVWCLILQASSAKDVPIFGPLVPKESRRTLIATESGVITAVDVFDGLKEVYHLQFFTLEPSSLFLPVLLHADMVFYVQTGRGTVSWARDDSKDGTTNLDVERGDVYRLEEGSIFYIRSHPDPAREKLRIHAIFNSFNSEDSQETSVGVYSNVSDLVRGFDDRVLQMGFKASEEAVQAIKSAIKPPPIVHFAPNKTEKPNWTEVFETLMGGRDPISLINGKKKKKTKTKAFNVFKETPDVENCNGWSVAVTNRGLSAFKHSNIGVFMVNLIKGSMMGPHWNPRATEIATVIEGQGMVQIVCASNPSGSQPTGLKCQNMRFKVREGDVFIVPRFHPMAQMSFNNESLVFMGFSTSVKNNRPQYLAGKWSVLRTIDRDILAVSLGASNATIEKILTSQDEGVMLECTSCAEEAEKTMEEEIERRREEEEAAKRKEEEEAKKREEEEARKREEEERKKKEEEERKREEEEERKRREEEEAKKREEEEARKREEEEEKKRREEEEARKREEEEEARRREEEERKREEEEEKKRKEEEEEARKREEEMRKREEEEEKKRREEEEARKREEEEEARKREEESRKREEEEKKKRREEEEARKREEEEEARRRKEEERKREEEEEKKRKEEEEEARKREEETRKREEEEKKRREEEEARKREEEARKREEEVKKRREEEEARKREEETRKEEEKEVKEEEEEATKREEEEEARKREEETRKEEEKEARKKQEEETRRREEEEGRERKEEETKKKEEEEARKREEEEEEIRRQEQEEIRRQEEEAKEREEGGGDRKIEEDEEEKKGRQETSGGGRVMWRKIWMAKS